MREDLEHLVRRGRGVFSRSAAVTAGISPDAIAWAASRGELHRLRRGVYTIAEHWQSADPVERHRLLVAAGQLAVPGSVAVADSAAVLLGLPVPTVPEVPRLLLAREQDRSGGRGAEGGTLGRRALLAHDEVLVRHGLRITTPARTVVDCARHLETGWALAVADAARRRWALSPEALTQAAERRPTAPGHRAAVRVALSARPEPESPLESLARSAVIVAGYPAPEPQVWVRTDRGDFRVDLMDADGVVIEADGKIKYTGMDAVWQEKLRQEAIVRRGHEVVRFTIADHHRPEPWLAYYRTAAARMRGRVA